MAQTRMEEPKRAFGAILDDLVKVGMLKARSDGADGWDGWDEVSDGMVNTAFNKEFKKMDLDVRSIKILMLEGIGVRADSVKGCAENEATAR